MNGGESYGAIETQYIRRHHKHEPRENQCTSALVKHIRAPVHLFCHHQMLSQLRSGCGCSDSKNLDTAISCNCSCDTVAVTAAIAVLE
ncbi:Abscisic acid receptor PYL9 [Glycine soja]|uniref:Abscisic acid receptor PYL9 n=1 Tax=Glycine soja TaxID=3848 RepID=A0A445GDI7_GLYSO|nr:Abscisic acid receptor PYL9 [Glycine soja]